MHLIEQHFSPAGQEKMEVEYYGDKSMPEEA